MLIEAFNDNKKLKMHFKTDSTVYYEGNVKRQCFCIVTDLATVDWSN